MIPRLLSAINQINDPHLKRFVNRMLGDKEIAEPFMRLRGSSRHHHAFSGGLLLHSIEVVEIILRMPNLDTQTRELRQPTLAEKIARGGRRLVAWSAKEF